MKSILRSSLCIVGISFLFLNSHAQGSDFITLKKRNNRTIKTYFSGIHIDFISIAGNEVHGMIKKVEKDSLFINIYDERSNYTIWGSSFWDTIAVSVVKYHYKEIREIMKPPQHFGFIRNGFIFKAGGIGYASLHTINALYLKEKIDPHTILMSGAAILTGIILKKIHHNTIRLGKLYYLQYIPIK